MIRCLVVVLAVAALAYPAKAAEIKYGEWELRRGGTDVHTILLYVNGDVVTYGQFVHGNNKSSFSGNEVKRSKSMLRLTQIDAKPGGVYVVHHVGVWDGSKFKGSWHDNDGNTGTFELSYSK